MTNDTGIPTQPPEQSGLAKPGSGQLQPPLTADPKPDYLAERVQVNGFPDGSFTDDRKRFGQKLIGFHITGKCPSCKHYTTALCATKYLAVNRDIVQPPATGVAAFLFRTRPTSLTGSVAQVTLLRCACVHMHKGAPAGAFGCGSEWLLTVQYCVEKPKERVEIDIVKDDESSAYWAPADNLATAIPNSVATAQAAAGKWQGLLTAIIGVFGITTLLAGHDTIAKLSTSSKVLFGIFVGIALVANAAMLYESDLASMGFPKIRGTLDRRAVRDSDLQPLRQAEVSVRKLRAALVLTAVSAGAAAVALGVFLLAPAAPDATKKGEVKLTVVIAKSATSDTTSTTTENTVTTPKSGQQGAQETSSTTSETVTKTSPQTTTLTTGCGKITYDKKIGPTSVTFTPDADGHRHETYLLSQVTSIDPC